MEGIRPLPGFSQYDVYIRCLPPRPIQRLARENQSPAYRSASRLAGRGQDGAPVSMNTDEYVGSLHQSMILRRKAGLSMSTFESVFGCSMSSLLNGFSVISIPFRRNAGSSSR